MMEVRNPNYFKKKYLFPSKKDQPAKKVPNATTPTLTVVTENSSAKLTGCVSSA